MERTMDFPGLAHFDPMAGGFDPSMPNSDFYKDPMFNPMMQYEQAYMYYRYLSMQLEYKIKCKEYEKLCNKPEQQKERRIE